MFHATAHASDDDDDTSSMRQGKLFMITNAAAGNVLHVYARSANGAASNIGHTVVGFRNEGGVLRPLADASGPAQVGFDAHGEALVIREKNATQIVAYRVRSGGTLDAVAEVTPSPGAVLYGFGITKRNVLAVSEGGNCMCSPRARRRCGAGGELSVFNEGAGPPSNCRGLCASRRSRPCSGVDGERWQRRASVSG